MTVGQGAGNGWMRWVKRTEQWQRYWWRWIVCSSVTDGRAEAGRVAHPVWAITLALLSVCLPDPGLSRYDHNLLNTRPPPCLPAGRLPLQRCHSERTHVCRAGGGQVHAGEGADQPGAHHWRYTHTNTHKQLNNYNEMCTSPRGVNEARNMNF